MQTKKMINLSKHPEVTIRNCRFREEFRLSNLEEGPALVFEDCVFEKGLCAKDAVIGRSVKLHRCELKTEGRKAVDFENARIRGDLTLWRCKLEGELYAPGLQADNFVSLIGCLIARSLSDVSRFLEGKGYSLPITLGDIEDNVWSGLLQEWEAPKPLSSAINLIGAQIGGDLHIRAQSLSEDAVASAVFGSVSCHRSTVGGNVNMQGMLCLGAVDFQGAHIEGGLLFQANTKTKRPYFRTVDGSLNFSGCTIDGQIDLAQAEIDGEVSLYRATVGGNVDLTGLTITGSLTSYFATVHGYVTAMSNRGHRLSVGGDIGLSGAEINFIELRGAEVSGKIEIITGKFERLFLNLGLKAHKQGRGSRFETFLPAPCRASAVIMSGIEVEEDLDVSGLEVRLPEGKTGHERERLRMEHNGAGFVLVQSRIGGGLKFFTDDPRLSLERRFGGDMERNVNWQSTPMPQELSSTIWGNLDLRANRIGGHLDLRNVKVAGSLQLRGTSVGRDLNMDAGDPAYEHFQTQCDAVNLEKIECEGDVMLSGLRARGDLLARDARVRNNVLFLPREAYQKSSRSAKSRIRIGGELDLTALSANHLVLSGANNSLHVGNDLVLSDAEIRHVELRGAKIGGKVEVIDGSFDDFIMAAGVDHGIRPIRVKAIEMRAITVTGNMDVSGLEVIASNASRGNQLGESGFVLTQSSIGQELTFFAPDDDASRIESDLDLRANTIGGNLDLRGIDVAGAIYLNDAKVGLDLRAGGTSKRGRRKVETICSHLDAEKLQCEGDLDFTGLRVLKENGKASGVAVEKRGILSARGARVKGQIAFLPREPKERISQGVWMAAGLRRKIQKALDGSNEAERRRLSRLEEGVSELENEINKARRKSNKESGHRDWIEAAEGIACITKKILRGSSNGVDVNQQEISVGDLHAELSEIEIPAQYRPNSSHPFVPGYALIDGGSLSLDLTAVNANHLILTGDNIPVREAKVSLERANLGRLEIVDPTPGPIDLSHVSVGRWVFGDKKDPTADDYIEVLKQMDPFDRTTWIGVENALRDQTKDWDANRVFRAMGWKARDEDPWRKNMVQWGKKVVQWWRGQSSEKATAEQKERGGSRWVPGPVGALASAVGLLGLSLWGVSSPAIVTLAVILAAGIIVVDWQGVYGRFFGFGTVTWWPMVVALIALPFSTCIFSQSNNVRATSGLLEVLGGSIRDSVEIGTSAPDKAATGRVAQRIAVSMDGHAEEGSDSIRRRSPATTNSAVLEITPDMLPEEYKWNTVDALALTVRYQVPIIPFLTHDRWEASSAEILRVSSHSLTAEEYAFMLTLWHWFAWPLFLIGAAAWAYRGRKK